MDAESYLTQGYFIRKQMEKWPRGTTALESHADVTMPGRLTATPVRREHGLPFLTATQVFDTRPRPRKWLPAGRTPDLESRLADEGTILVTRSGMVGDAIMAYLPHQDTILSDDLLRVKAHAPEEQGFLYAWLRTEHARAMMRSTKYGNIIKHLEPGHLRELPVPDMDSALRAQTHKHIQEVFRLRDKAYALASKAEEMYVTGLGLKEPAGGEPAMFSASALTIFSGGRRLDAYHHNLAAEAAVASLRASGHEIAELGDQVQEIFGVPRFKHVYKPSGIPYVDSEDLFKVNAKLDKFIPATVKKNAKRYFVERNWILMACSGQIYGINGSTVLAGAWHEEKIISNHVLRIVPHSDDKGLRAGYIHTALGHRTLGRPMVIRWAFGTEVPEIAAEDVARIPIIVPPSSLEDRIADAMEEAEALREQADALEDETIRGLEEALVAVLGPPAQFEADVSSETPRKEDDEDEDE